MEEALNTFRFLTSDSIKELNRLYKESCKNAKEAKKKKKHEKSMENCENIQKPKRTTTTEKKCDKRLEAGKSLPPHLGDYFPKKKFAGKILEDIDPYYKDKRTFVVVNKAKTIFRFSSTNAFFIFSPFNPFREAAVKILTHTMFSTCVLITIIVNCVFMALDKELQWVEITFTAIYTAEFIIKAVARGLIFNDFMYLRDMWNWLDFIVIGLAYLMFFLPSLGNLSALRSLRVLRALKTVTTVPGMKTVVSALLEAIIKLRDALVLTLFMLSIFALIGLQMYRGTLLHKCIIPFSNSSYIQNATDNGYNLTEVEWFDALQKHINNPDNWKRDSLCYNTSDGKNSCPKGYDCYRTLTENPNFNYTNFDNFVFALLCSFRLMTQDYWESLYQLTISANGDIHMVYFMVVIFFGSFYLVNVILAIVAMSYDDVRQADMAETEEEEAEKREEEVKREQLMEEIDHELDGTSEDLTFRVLDADEENERSSIKSCTDISHLKLYCDVVRNRSRSLQWNVRKDKYYVDSQLFSKESFTEDNERMVTIVTSQNQIPTVISSTTEINDVNEVNEGLHLSVKSLSKDGKLNLERKSSRLSILNENLEDIENMIKDPDLKRKLTMLDVYEKENKLRKREIFMNWFLENFCDWECCPAYVKLRKIVTIIVLDPFMEMFITICIVLNTAFMAMDMPSNSEEMNRILKNANFFFMGTFAFEAAMKLIAHSPQKYFTESWNILDFVIVVLSLVEIYADSNLMSLLRSFRLLRVFKLAKSWQTMNLLFTIIGQTLGAIGNLCIVLGIIVFIFAVVGMQLFGKNYEKFKNSALYPDCNGEIPRWNFRDFPHSFMIVFRVLCGEYIETMWNCMRVNGMICVPFFLLTMILGNLAILNLFLALLLSSFGSESLQRREDESSDINKLQEAIDRIYRAVVWIKVQFKTVFKSVNRRMLLIYRRNKRKRYPEPWSALSSYNSDKLLNVSKLLLYPYSEENQTDFKVYSGLPLNMWLDIEPKFDADPEINEAQVVYWHNPNECLPDCIDRVIEKGCKCFIRSFIFKAWWWIRCQAFRIVDHKYFENFILAMIAFSSLTLTLEDKNLSSRPELKKVLEVLDKIFTIIFTIEMILKWLAIGLTKYFKDAWCWLDFVIVMMALFSFVLSFTNIDRVAGMGGLKAMRTLRALRPLRAVSRWEGMKIVVNALIQAIPSIFNVLLVCLVFWLIFSIIGMQLFGGKFYKCVYTANATGRVDSFIVPNKNVCQTMETLHKNVTWKNSEINFDNVLNGYLALFQVATFKGWIEIMADSVDITDYDQQPIYNHRIRYYIYYVLFIVFGTFFTLNLFIGVIIDNFNIQKKKVGGSLEMFMTEDQKKYYNAMKKMSSSAPQKPPPKPQNSLSIMFYNIITNQKFDVVIMCFIMLNTVVMCIEHHNQTEEFRDALDQINKVFILIFSGESIIKILALKWYYFKVPWNVFDFVIVLSSIVFLILENAMVNTLVSPTIIRVVRLFRIGRVLRLIKAARGIRTLLFSLIVSLPALFNIALLLILIMFIYAIVGMSFFGNVAHYSGIDKTFNFETFGKSMIILFQICTTAGWNSILEGLMNTKECSKEENNCGNYLAAVLYLVSYLLINAIVIVNMYIAVILENFSQATKDVQQGLTQDDYDLFYECWETYDPEATGFIHLKDLSEFVDKIGEPLGIKKPNKIQLAILEIPICKGDTICCMDLLDKLTKNFLGGTTCEETQNIVSLKPTVKEDIAEKKIVISNTYLLQKQHWAAIKVTYFMRCLVKKRKEIDIVDS